VNLVYVNGQIVPAEEARVSIFDRGFLYGDGVFETIRVQAGRLFRGDEHVSRLSSALALTRIKSPEAAESLTQIAARLIAANQCTDGVLRLAISRGCGTRGYSPRGAGPSTMTMTLHPRPVVPEGGWRLRVSNGCVWSLDVLGGIKASSRLSRILARAEAEEVGADDAVLLNERRELTETSSSNLFWIDNGSLCTPAREAGILSGVSRGILLELARKKGLAVREVLSGPQALKKADGVFVANVVSGPVAVTQLDDDPVRRWDGFPELQTAFEQVVVSECGR
jgi:branched-chain amino acid aminotransferase